jgi:hypothetical protein
MWDWDVFISHASEDKAAVARPLYEFLQQAGLKVWLDENELRVGDSLRAKIDSGLAKSRYGVVVLSTAFFSKDWPERELNALVTLESSSRRVIIPVWHGVDHDTVAKYSPILADRLACSTEEGLSTVARKIIASIRDPRPAPASVSPPATKNARRLLRTGVGASLLFLIVSAVVALSSPFRNTIFALWQAKNSQSYISYGFVQLKGTRLEASTKVVLTVFLNASPNFAGVRLKLRGADIEGIHDGDLSGYLDPERGSPQAVEIHLKELKANAQVVTCLIVPEPDTSAKSQPVRIRQVFAPLYSRSDDVDFVAVGTPRLAANEAACEL